jgi:hypothetical protein
MASGDCKPPFPEFEKRAYFFGDGEEVNPRLTTG